MDISDERIKQYVDTGREVIEEAHASAIRNGFWSDRERMTDGEILPLKLARVHSEVSEAFQVLSKNKGMGNFEEELADIIITVYDIAGCLGLQDTLHRRILDKIAYNDTRGYKHGKNL